MPAEIRHSVCALDCPDCCGLLVHVENGSATRLRGNPDHPVTRGFLCGKVARYLEREYHPNRLLYPLRRAGAKGEGKWERIGWEEALDEIAARLAATARQHGAESILPYSYCGTMGLLNGASMDRRFFHRLGASRLDRTICASAGTVGLVSATGGRFGTEPEQFVHARLIIAWGANIHGTNIHLWPFIVEARRRGAKLVVIDPVRTRTAAVADEWVPIQPGTDLALALGFMHVIFRDALQDREYLDAHATGAEELRERVAEYTPDRTAELTGIPAQTITRLARAYATTRPCVIRLNYGVQRSDRGAAAVQAIALLPVLTGSYRDRGGGLQLSTTQAFQFNRAALEREDLQPAPTRIVNMSELGRALNGLSGPRVHALFVYNSNPAAVAPDGNAVRRGLLRDDLFTVVMEHFLTDTADLADLVLPATTFLEHTDLYLAYGHYYVQLARPALPPPGEARSNVDVFRALAKRMGFTEPAFQDTDDDLVRQALASGHPFLEGITLERLDRERFIRLNLPSPFVPFASGAATPDRKFALHAPELTYQPPVESFRGDAGLLRRFPLQLVSSKNDDGLNSTFGEREENARAAGTLILHPDDAAARNIRTGDAVRVRNERGDVRCTASVGDGVRAGVVRIPAVGWPKRTPAQAVNVLTSQRLTDRGGGPTFFSCLVEVQRCTE